MLVAGLDRRKLMSDRRAWTPKGPRLRCRAGLAAMLSCPDGHHACEAAAVGQGPHLAPSGVGVVPAQGPVGLFPPAGQLFGESGGGGAFGHR